MSEAVRRDIVDQVRASAALEGLAPSPEHDALIDLWVKGEMTLDEIIEQTLDRYRNAKSSAVEYQRVDKQPES